MNHGIITFYCTSPLQKSCWLVFIKKTLPIYQLVPASQGFQRMSEGFADQRRGSRYSLRRKTSPRHQGLPRTSRCRILPGELENGNDLNVQRDTHRGLNYKTLRITEKEKIKEKFKELCSAFLLKLRKMCHFISGNFSLVYGKHFSSSAL